MKKILIVLLTMVLFLVGCGKTGGSFPQSSADESVVNHQEPSPSETEMASEDNVIPGSYTVPDGWTKSEKHSTDSQIFYIEEGHEDDEKPDNISIHVGKNNYSLEEHEQFRDAIVQQILMQLDGIEAQLNGDGTYTEQGDLLYIFTIDEGDIVTTQYYIVKDYGFCLIQLTNFSGLETTEQAARDMVDSFVWM
jgi:hypothetical protein